MFGSRMPLRVVVADDSSPVRQHLVRMLSALDRVHVVAEAADVPQTLAMVREKEPEVVVLDIQMPGGNGISALKEIRQEYPGTCIIMLTNHSNPFYRATCMKEGADFFLDKSIEFEKVSDVLAELMNAGEA